MQAPGARKQRSVVPIWREFIRTHSGELKSSSSGLPIISPSDEPLLLALTKWRNQPTIARAADVIGKSFLSSKPELSLDAARYLTISGSTATRAVQKVAKRVIDGPPLSYINNFAFNVLAETGTKGYIRARIGVLKKRTRLYSANPMDWLEIARLHCLIAQFEPARSAIRIALGNAPNNRVVLRASARFLIHVGDPEHALYVLRRSDAIGEDPWVQAAEIAVASSANKTPISIRNARSVLARRHLSALQTSELASALATEELRSGSRRQASKHFRQSVIDPTDNAVAQAVWAREKFHINIKADPTNVPGAFEGRVLAATAGDNFESALENCICWLRDEPFSSAPATTGSHLATVFRKDYSFSEKIARVGLIANPNNNLLKNNLVVALAHQGLIDAAEEVLTQLNWRDVEDRSEMKPTLYATKGLLKFRRNNIEDGRSLYKDSVMKASKRQLWDTAFRAKIHWFNEEMRASTIPMVEADRVRDILDDDVSRRKANISSMSKAVWSQTKSEIWGNCQAERAVLCGDFATISDDITLVKTLTEL